ARKGLEAARDSLLALTVRFPDDGRFQYDLAMTHLNLGTTLAQAGKEADARKELEAARKLFTQLSDAHPHVTEYTAGLARTQRLAFLKSQTGERERALKTYAEARERLAALMKAHPDVPQYRAEYAAVCNDLGEGLFPLARWDEAADRLVEARDLLLSLHQAQPEVATFRRLLGTVCNNLGAVEMKRGRLQAAS